MTDLSKLLGDLTPAKRALLSLHLKNRAERAAPADVIPRRPDPDFAPLSFAQKRLWFLNQLEPDSTVYNEPLLGIRLTGRLDVRVLRRALDALVERHETLRTTFRLVDGQPRQLIAAPAAVPLPLVDLSPLPAGRRRAETDAWLRAESARLFDLARGPLTVCTLLRLERTEHLLLIARHHIISDAWSTLLLLRELTQLYKAFAGGFTGHGSSPLPELPIQYADFSWWQSESIGRAGSEAQLAWWKEKLAAPPVVELPADHLRPPAQSFRGAQELSALSLPLTTALHRLAQERGATLFMVILAAFEALLARITGQDDLVVGTPVAGRTRSELEGLIGFFANLLPLRADLTGDPTFKELLERIRQDTLEAFARQDLPFEQLVDALQIERDPSRPPLVQVVFVLHNTRLRERLEVDDLQLSLLEIGMDSSKFDLTLAASELDGGLEMLFEYSTDLFDRTTVQRLLRHLGRLLEAMTFDVDSRPGRVDLLTAPERHQLTVEWNDMEREFPRTRCLHELFAEHAAERPDAPAILTPAESLTYAELDRRANRLAWHLRSLGVRTGDAVGISCSRSAHVAVGLLGIAKAGAAYMPLDPDYPAERLAFLMEDAGLAVLVTEEAIADRLPSDRLLAARGQRVLLDADAERIAARPDTAPKTGVTPEHPAYMIYTSGSTGTPKGVIVDHRGRVSNFADFNGRFGVGPGDRVLGISSLSFDMSAYDVFGTLMAGAALVFPAADAGRDPAAWARLMREHRVSVWHSVPALLEMLVEYVADRLELHPSALRLVLLGGDWIPVTLPDRLRALDVAPGIRVVSMGGATEVSMDSTIHVIGEVDARWKSIPYGRPMWNQRAYVLDPGLLPMAIGVPGELYLGGIGVAQGYHHRPELTAARFVPDPFAGLPGARMYRTGDLSRFGREGELELLGRVDFQIKIRGLRIELGEIEAAMRRHPAVREALVVARGERAGAKRLVGYAVPEDGESLEIEELRSFLGGELPESMVPSAFVLLAALPLTPNGKVDRRSLPEPEETPAEAAAFVSPRTLSERMLAEIWSQVLGRERIGVHDNFFALGGDSILSIQVVARANGAGLALQPRDLFQRQTIAGLAEIVGEAQTPATAESLETPVPDLASLAGRLPQEWDVEEVAPLSPMQRNMLDRWRRQPSPGLYVVQNSFPLPGDVDPDLLEEAWREVIRHHPILRTGFAWEGLDEPVQVVHRTVALTLERLDWRHFDPERQRRELQALFQAERARGFDLGRPPLFRLFLIRMADDGYQFLKVDSYLLLDAWSEFLLRDRLLTVYQALERWERPVLEPGRPFRDYTVWARRQGGSEAFWRPRLEGLVPLPLTVGPRPVPEGEPWLAKQALRLPAEATTALQESARRWQVTVGTVVQAAWALELARWTGRPDVVFGVTSSGRPPELAGIEGMTGLLINTLPLRVQVPAEEELSHPEAWLSALQTLQVEMRQHEHAPLPDLQRWAGVGEEALLFESILVFANYPVSPVLFELATRIGPGNVHALEDWSLAQTEFPLRVDVEPAAELSLGMTYYRNRFTDAEVAERLQSFADRLSTMGKA